ncbi:hypothetical protein P171DRAFT_176563 [Karstenula rhodostoma CBS 690.94]|uniref:Transmembrane protein n=1 Tax=Karstenula rhodostoma CBS 690.94 TaxID=1392251 RepID=A0A9P4P421_9PLEO|nr:hypothetical protein P171DRAFT_176563 [Karstenula rhodostoma CBS 690.94]
MAPNGQDPGTEKRHRMLFTRPDQIRSDQIMLARRRGVIGFARIGRLLTKVFVFVFVFISLAPFYLRRKDRFWPPDPSIMAFSSTLLPCSGTFGHGRKKGV